MKNRSNKPFLLRSPMIRSVGRTLHHKSVPSESCYDSDESDLTEEPVDNETVNNEHFSRYWQQQKLDRQQDLRPNDLRSLVNDCCNMSLMGHETNDKQVTTNSEDDQNRCNTTTISNNQSVSSSSSCSQQARMPSNNCDVTMDELASYFETFVHIPKKMSSMAEMMYI